jgi:MFS family permease
MKASTQQPATDRQTGVSAVLWSSCVAMLAIGANGTVIMAALPTMRADLALDAADVQWAVNAYLVVSAACIVLGGDASDRFGARRVAVAGLVLFAAASVIIALSTSAAMLLTGRALQGLASALAVPSTLAALGTVIPPERRAAAMAAWTGFLMLGFGIGPLFGGAVTHLIGWRVIFWLNIAMMALATTGMAAGADGGRAARTDPRGTDPRGTDWGGFMLLATFMIALVFGLLALPRIASAPLAASGPLALAAVAFAALLSLERRVAAPLFVRAFFSLRHFATGVGIGSVSMFCIMALLPYFNLFAQSPEGLRDTPLEAGTALLPLSAALLAVVMSAPAIAARIGLRTAMTVAMALIVTGSAVIFLAVSGFGSGVLSAGFVLMGAGLAMPYASAPRLALSALAREQAGKGSGIVNACTFLAGSVGAAGGAIATQLGGFLAVLAMLALAGLLRLAVSRLIPDQT